MSKVQSLNEYGQVKQPTNRDVRQLGVLTGAKYEADSTANQTVINLNFSVAQTTEAKRGFMLFVGDSSPLREGTTNDFTFTNIVGGVSAQVTLNGPIGAGLNIVAYQIGAYQSAFPNPSTVTATLLNDVAQPNLMALAGFQNFVQKTFVTAPNTQILNRAQVEGAALKAIAGVERVQAKSLLLTRHEFGPNGEPVWELENKDSRFRFVGASWIASETADGGRLVSGTNTTGDFVEATFYGTGFSILTYLTTTLPTVLLTLDGGTEAVTTIFPSGTNSTILGGRNYIPNQSVSIVNNLTLGWHTVKLRISATGASGFNVSGFQVLNERTDLAILPGTAYGGMKQETLSALFSSAFNTGVTGTRGARIVRYIQNGVISQAVTNVNTSAAFMTAADHTNEEVIRKIKPTEFNANRGDDYSPSLGVVARSFTLDDGTTSMSNSVAVGYFGTQVLDLQAATGARTHLTFVGTGLDFVRQDNVAGATTATVYVDGVLVGSLNTAATGAVARTEKLVSGLPYGTHVVAIVANAGATTSAGCVDWLIYGPKKPTLPAGAVEIGETNVMASYVANTLVGGTATFGAIAQGVIRKVCSREINYTNVGGSWSIATVIGSLPTGWSAQSDATVGNYMEYVFYGTGIEYRDYVDSNSRTSVVLIDGQSNFTTTNLSPTFGAGWSNVPVTSHYSSATDTFTASTGTISGGSTGGTFDSGTSISGLNLGWHKIRVTKTGGAGASNFWALDIITPIHINPTSFKTGSLSINDRRAFSPVIDKPDVTDLTKLKAMVTYDPTTNKILKSVNVSAVLQVSTGVWNVYFAKPFKDKNWAMSTSVRSVNRLVFGASGTEQASYAQIGESNLSGTSIADAIWSADFFGELEDEGEI